MATPFGILTPATLVTYYCFIGGCVYDITSAAHALRLRGKVLDGRRFKLSLCDPSQPNGGRSSAAASDSFDGGARKGGAGSAKRRGKSGPGKKKRCR